MGCGRNVGKVLPKEISILKSAFAPLGEVSFFIVESDSSDNTIQVLDALSTSLPNFSYTTLGELGPVITDRLERMARCRNAFVSHIRSISNDALDYIVVADLDGVNKDLTSDSVATCFTRTDWDGVMTNQGRNYYDVYTLREPEWCPRDTWAEFWRLRSEGMKELRAKETAIHQKQIRIPKDSPWIPVDSAFGGLAIYRKDVFDIAEYSGHLEDGVSACEHVYFNLTLRKFGKKLFINPALINSVWNEHNYIHKFLPRTRRKLALIKEWIFA